MPDTENRATPAATPERVSDETLAQLVRANSDKTWEPEMARELIARRKSGSAVEAYDDVLRMIDNRIDQIAVKTDEDFYRGAVNNLRTLKSKIEQRRRDAAGEKT